MPGWLPGPSPRSGDVLVRSVAHCRYMTGSGSRIASGHPRCPAVIRALPLAPQERALHASECAAGCRLVATRHGLWDWPARGVPTRVCWRAISSISYGAGRLRVRTRDGSAGPCDHRIDPSDGFADLIPVLDRGSLTVDFSVRLSSGRPARVQAR